MDIGINSSHEEKLGATLPEQAPPRVTPPRERGKPGRKLGQKTGTGNSRKTQFLRSKKAKVQPQTEAERIEAIAGGGATRAATPAAFEAEGAPAKRKSKPAAMGADKFAKSLQGLHKGAAFIAQEPALELDDVEARMVADALYGIFEEYDIVINAKAAAAVNLAGAVMIVYGPRVAIMRGKAVAKVRQAKTQKPAAPPEPEAAPAIEPIIPADFFGGSGGAAGGG